MLQGFLKAAPTGFEFGRNGPPYDGPFHEPQQNQCFCNNGYLMISDNTIVVTVRLRYDFNSAIHESDTLFHCLFFEFRFSMPGTVPVSSVFRCPRWQVLLEYFILQHDYNVFRINEVLFEYDLPLPGTGDNVAS